MASGGKKKRSGGGRTRRPFEDTQKIEPGELLGEDCPVRALGHQKKAYYFSDPVGQVCEMRAGEMTPNGVISLFLGDMAWLRRECPTGSKRESKGTDRTDWHNPTAVQRLITACRREGFFDPATQTRGPGIWPYQSDLMLDEEFIGSDMLVIHVGDRVGVITYDGHGFEIGWEPAGVKIGDFVYPASAPQPNPDDESPTEEDWVDLQRLLDTWTWRDGDTVPMLVIGWLICAVMPAGMPFRPGGWVQGGSGVGKSAFLTMMELLLQGRPLKYDDATAAGLRDDFKERNDARPVILNEAEVSEDNRRLGDLVKMARYVYTAGEGTYRRGGSGGSAHALTTIFLFAAIEPPPLLPQDANRIAMFRLGPLAATAEQMEDFEEKMPALARRLGPKLTRRAIEVWPKFPATLNAFRKGLMEEGHTQRMANTFGTLLSAAHLALYGAVPDDSDVAEWAGKLDAKLLANRDDHRTSEGLCLMHMMTSRVAAYRAGVQTPLGEYVRRALYGKDPYEDRKVIKGYGLAVASMTVDGKHEKWLAVSNRHQGLEEIFKGTRWANGAWVEALRLLHGARVSPRPIHFGGAQDRATLIPTHRVPDMPFDLREDDVQDLGHGEVADG